VKRWVGLKRRAISRPGHPGNGGENAFCIGDPARGVAAVIKGVHAAELPLHFVLGSDASRRTQEKPARFAAELEHWKAVSLGTDFGSR
jgi:hypothetical protein